MTTRRTCKAVAIALAVALAAGGGCVYRLTVQQGNLVDEDKVAQIEVGMTRKQVRFLLGTPLVDDPFHRDRWDYLYYVRPGRDDPRETHWITVYFEGDIVSRLVRDDPPDDVSIAERSADSEPG